MRRWRLSVLPAAFLFVLFTTDVVLFTTHASSQNNPEPTGWYAGDMHVHRSCGGSPEAISSVYGKMSNQNLSTLSLLADMGNGEVQNPTTDLPLVNGQDQSLSTPSQILHWDAEWHWDATYSQYAHQALGGHIVALGLKEAHQIWDESTDPIFQWAHAQGGVAGFAHMQYLGSGFPSSLNCCIPVEYPVEVALGSADFVSEDVNGSDTAIQAYYRLLNSGFRPGLAAGTDYPCNSGAIGAPLTYARVPGGLSYRSYIDAIASGKTVVSLSGHSEFLDLIVNSNARPGDEVRLASAGTVPVTVQWTAIQSFTGTIELVFNGVVVASKSASVDAGTSATLSATVSFPKSGWLAARRMDSNGHVLHTAAVFVIVNNAPIRVNTTDPQFFVQWINNLLTNTSSGGSWNWYFPTELSAAQSRYQTAKSLYQQIVNEAQGTGPTLTSITLTPANSTIATGSTQQFTATGNYSNGTSLNVTGQAAWSSSNSTVASVTMRGLAAGLNTGTALISATLGNISGSTQLNVQTNPLTISTTSLGSGIAGNSYSAALAASGGTSPYTWSIATGTLPNGLILNSTTGAITGIPTTAGSYSFTVQAADSSTPQQKATKALGIVIASSGGGSCPCSIWPAATVPGLTDSGPDSAVELGVTFRADIDGYITGIRFYKGAGNTGTHVGNLWRSSGSLLATITFSGETASGWQQANFSSPVAVTANTVYVASYHTSVGHYSDDQNFFATAGVDNAPLHALADGVSGFNGVYAYGSASAFPNQGWRSSNYWVDVVFTSGSTTTPPTVVSITPSKGSTGVSIGSHATAAFDHSMTAGSITESTFVLADSSGTPVQATVDYSTASSTATLTPSVELTPSTKYTATIRGGSAGVQDVNGNTMASDYTWSFTTGAAPSSYGPGGPILVIANVLNPFSSYYSEILNAEGFNEYTVADIATVTATNLANYDVVILGEMPLTSGQTTMLSNWVNRGGYLIAMRPDKQLTSLLGLTDRSSTLPNGYLVVHASSGPGAGIVGQSMQFHGTADLYALSGASSIATLYADASSPTASPAVTIANAGNGRAAAFAYDLARSVVYTRQGNPAWSGQKRDGEIPPIRSDDLYFGAASFDPELDWIDLNKVAIPQADEQQRLLANLILSMDAAKKPLPRFWYLPSGAKAAVVMTGDDHGNGGSTGRFDTFIADSPAGCSVADWGCIRSTAYVYPGTPITATDAAAYTSQGFEIALHVTTDCVDWTPAALESMYTTQLDDYLAQFPSLAAPRTERTHCIAWSDYDTQPKVEFEHGIRFDTNYYYWPPEWVLDRPGMFTGSGMPMRFADRTGNTIDVYQAATQMTDESGQSYPLNIDTLLDNAVGPQGFYGVFTANMHNDSVQSDGADAIVASAQAHGVPVVSSLQMLTWLDGRNASSFDALNWTGNTLSFTVNQGSGARNLRAILPAIASSGTLSSVTRGGTPIAFSTQTIKGINYAMFNAVSGSYQAIYGGGPPVVVVASVDLSPASGIGGYSSAGTVTLSGPAPAGGAVVALSSSNAAVASVVGSVTVPAGGTSASFTVSTVPVSSTATSVITATYGASASSTLTVNPPSVSSVTLSPTVVLGGANSTGTVTLNGAAPAGGAAVTLASSNTTAAQVTSPVVIPAGNTSTTFTVTTATVSTTTTVNVTASYGGNASASLTVNPTLGVASISLNPTSVVGGNNSTGTVRLNMAAPTGGVSVALRSSNSSAATVPASVTVAAGATSANFTITTLGVASSTTAVITATLGGSATATLTITQASLSSVTRTPGSVIGGNNSTGTVTLTGSAPPSGAVITLNSSNASAAQVPQSVSITAGAKTATFVITTTPVAVNTSVTITATYGVARTTTITVNAASLSSLTRSPSSVVGGNNSTGTVTLNGAAPAGGALVTLSSNNTPVAQVPASITIAAGATSTTFPITTTGVASSTSVTITGVYGTTRSNTLTVTVAALSSLTLSPGTVTAGGTSTGTLTLNGAAPPAGAVVSLSSSNTTAAQVPSSATIPAGSRTITFAVTTGAVHGTSAIIRGTYRSTTRSATLTVQ